MDNSFGARQPWNGNLNQSGQLPRYPAGMDPRIALENTLRPSIPQMNGFPPMRQVTPASTGGYPMWDMDIPSQMFMQAVNFDRLMSASSGGPQSMVGSLPSNVAGRNMDDSLQKSEAGLDLIEQQQAMEQARLLQRFKELRHMQQQQQEMLMSQQQQQLTMLKKEQQRVHGMISKQRDQQWGGGRPNNYDEMSTPPRHHIPPGTDVARLMAANMASQQLTSQQIASLPRPVMYVHPKEDDDEIKTNPDLFSDTNSNRGSQAAIEDGMFPIPDSASEASVDIVPQQRLQNKMHFQQRFNPHELDAPKKLHRSFAELEADEDFINQSYNSPTILDMQHGRSGEKKSSHRDNSPEGRNAELEDVVEDEEEDDSDDDDDDESDDESDEEESDDDDNEDDECQENTQIEVVKDPDDIPIKPGIEGAKTFEQLLEEQLKLEEEKLKQASSNQDSPSQPKRCFLKKGEGIARFDKPNKKQPRSRNPKKSSSSTSTNSTKVSKASTKPGSGSAAASQKQGVSKSSKPPVQSTNKTSSKPGQKSTQAGPSKTQNNTESKGRRSGSKSPPRDSAKTTAAINAEGNKKVPKKLKKSESIPDDTSFVASLKEREKESQQDMADLDEFEILEEFADNMSFCSNSSIVTKGLKGLQSDRILTGVLPKSQAVGRPTSPRATLIKKLEAEKHANLKQTNNKLSAQNKNENSSQLTSMESLKLKATVKDSEKKNMAVDDEDDEYETVSESSDDSSDDTSDDSDDDSNEIRKVASTGHLDVKLSSEDKSNTKNDSALSTDKKLIRVLSYTGMTETSVSQTSESELDTDSETTDSNEENENISPTKVLTRKVAGRDDKSTSSAQKPSYKHQDFLTTSFNSSAYAPKSKSPLVISREKVSIGQDLTKDVKFSYHSDSDSVGKQRRDSTSDDGSEVEDSGNTTKGKKGVSEKKTLLFDDDDEWDEDTPVSNKRGRNESRGDSELDKTLVDEQDTDKYSTDSSKPFSADTLDSTPPTSKLVSKLFPKLKPQQKKKEEQDLQKIQTVAQTEVGDGAQSKVLRDKLIELEREIEKFRNENAHLAKLRTNREEGLSKLKKEMSEFEKEKAEELKRLEEFKKEEMKKLKQEKKTFEKYQKAARAGPDKREREEIEMLKAQLVELQEEMKRKESRWTANNTRLRDKIDGLEQENDELKEEIKIMEKKRLEWMQRDQNKTKSRVITQVPQRSSTPTDDITQPHMTNGYLDHGQELLNDLSTSSSIRSSSSLKPSQNNPKIITRSSIPPQNRPGTNHPTQSHIKMNNLNQSSKSSVSQNSQKANQSKKGNTHNVKPAHPGQGSSHNKAGPKTVSKTNTGKPASSSVKNVLRNSLAEDLPRRELGTIAELQDISMYSETDAEISMHAMGNMPRKFASRPAVDKSIIDKGDNDFDETQHSDGKVERSYTNGAREILFSNGTRKEISSDGKSIVVSFFNGDYKQIMPDQRVIYFYSEAQTTHSSYPDGLEILQFPNQQTEKVYPDGTKEITFPDQTVKYIFPNGSEESIFADGTVIRLEKNGDKTMEFPNGQREIHTQEYKKREYPDGTVKTVYPDGRQETRYSNGRLRIKDKDGNVIVDRLC